MTKITASLFTIIVPGLLLATAPARAQLSRTFVSAATGVDSGNCDRPTPCRTFQFAHDNTLANGEITVLDPGSYGSVNINRAISIINDGVGEAGALVSGGTGSVGIYIAAPNDAAVTLRGLTIKGLGPDWPGGKGIYFATGASLTVENCVIRNLTDPNAGVGIAFVPNGSTGRLTVSNTLITDNGGPGIDVFPIGAASATNVVLDRVGLYNNYVGLWVDGAGTTGSIVATVVNSTAAGNSGRGFYAKSAGAKAVTTIVLDRSVSAGNGVGIQADLAQVMLDRSVVTGNTTTLQASGANSILSYRDNQIDLNLDGQPGVITQVFHR